MADIGDIALETGGYLAAGAAIEAAAYGITKMTSKATLYVRLKGISSGSLIPQINEDVFALRSLLKKKGKQSEKLASRAGKATSQASVAANAAMGKMSEAALGAEMLTKGFVPVEVQYNPATLTFNTVGGKIRNYTAMGNENMNAMSSTDKQTSTYMSVQLVYENINTADAFGSSSLNANASDLINTGASVIKNLFGDGYSVKKPVEGLLSLLLTKETRQVIFVWNNMFFHGELVSARANFSMFNKLGHPISATVSLEIQQSNGNATFASDKQYWNDAFDQVYITPGAIKRDNLVKTLLDR